MALFLVQHGKSLPKEIDPDQGLSDEGRAETGKIAAAAREHGIRIRRILQSGKKRASETAAVFAEELQPPAGVQEGKGMNPLDDVAAFANKIDTSEDLMIVSHLPFLERLTSFLVTGTVEKPVIRFQNSGIVRLDKDPGTGYWTILWTLFPRLG